MNRRFALAVSLLLVGCVPTTAPTATGTPDPAASSPSSPAAVLPSVPGATTLAYAEGRLEVDGAAVELPAVLYYSTLGSGEAIVHQYGVGIPAEAKEGGWFAAITYGTQGTARNLVVQLNQKTGPRAQDLLFLSFTRLDAGDGKPAAFLPADATGTATEHDGKIDVSFTGTLAGIPASKHSVTASFPNLPL